LKQPQLKLPPQVKVPQENAENAVNAANADSAEAAVVAVEVPVVTVAVAVPPRMSGSPRPSSADS